ncbi:MAG: hypothetical protein M3198_15500 [Actinomycetota bacterium]|nr:hypothetical protein [Actinomycetota bacterium]
MSWRVFATAASEPDFQQLSDEERAALNEDLFAWVDTGPPRRNRRPVFDFEVFEDLVPSGFRVTYIVNEAGPYVALLRVRKA